MFQSVFIPTDEILKYYYYYYNGGNKIALKISV